MTREDDRSMQVPETQGRLHRRRRLSTGLVGDFLSFTLDGFNNRTNITNGGGDDDVIYRVHRPPGSKLDILTISSTSSSSNNAMSNSTRRMGLCNLVTISYLTGPGKTKHDGDGDDDSRYIEIQAGLHPALSSYLAIKHLNHGDGSIVPALAGLKERCNIHFVPEFLDTGFVVEASRAIDVVQQVLARDSSYDNNSTCPAAEPTAIENHSDRDFPEALPACGFIGSQFSETSALTAALTGHEDYPQVSGSSAADSLDDRNFYPRFARTIPAQIGTAKAIINYLVQDPSFMEAPYLAVLYIDNEVAHGYLTRAVQVVENYNTKSSRVVHIEGVALDPALGAEGLRRQISKLKDLRFQTVFAILPQIWWQDFYSIIEEAYRQKAIGHGDTVWYFGEDAIAPILHSDVWPNKEAMYDSFVGSGMIWPGDASDNPLYAEFALKLKELQQSEEDITFLKAALSRTPGINETELEEILMSDGFLEKSFLDPRIVFVYEATLLLGLAACNAVTDDLFLDGTVFYTTLSSPSSSFRGITGNVELDLTGTRSVRSTSYLMLNFVQSPTVLGDISYIATGILMNGTWANNVGNNRLFVYNDGTTDRPRPPSNYNLLQYSPDPDRVYVNPIIEGFSYLFLAIAIVLAVVCVAWTWMKRNSRIVRSSQPVFLYIICFGVAVIASSIVPITLDIKDLSLTGLSRACNANIWLTAIGVSIIFSALASKTHRINVIMRNAKKFRRIKISVRSTLIPIVVSVTANIIILALMTSLNPIEYKLEVVSEDRFGRPESFQGRCENGGRTAFWVPLIFWNALILSIAVVEAWLARNISTEFQETEHIYRALGGILVVAFVGIPVLVLVNDNANASVFVKSAITFIFCLSILLNLFVPKMMYEKERNNQNIHISGVATSVLSPSVPDGNQFPSMSETSDDSNTVGDRILSMKTRQEMIEENALLKKEIIRLRNRNRDECPDGTTEEDIVAKESHIAGTD